jgi:hypothetical protein
MAESKSYIGQLISDSIAGLIAGAGVAPIVSAVDRALAENASGKATLGTSFSNSMKELAANPVQFIKSPQFLWIWLIYGATYATANACQTVCDKTNRDVALPKLASTFLVNTTTCIGKDRAFAKIYGAANAAKTVVPNAAYGAWLVRDVGSMAVFFTLPPIVGREIAKVTGSERSGYYAAQMGLPLVFQTVFTPIHLLGYDIVNNPNNSVAQRFTFLQKDYFKNVGMRCVRQAPPWSIGTIANKELRSLFHRAV